MKDSAMDAGAMRIEQARYLIIDLEATCSNDGSVPREEMELIEIGAVMLDAQTFEVASEFQSFVRPVRHRRLTEFCTSLTTITQAEIDVAPLFPQAVSRMQDWLVGFDEWLFCSWGNYDRTQFLQDCAFHGVPYPFGEGHFNVKDAFSKWLDVRRRFGLGEALTRLGLEFEGTQHRGIDDVRNIARVIRRVCEEVQQPKPPMNADKRR
jgi:inhibitor of KinA sporulation pathway (predicted exonuclease)